MPNASGPYSPSQCAPRKASAIFTGSADCAFFIPIARMNGVSHTE